MELKVLLPVLFALEVLLGVHLGSLFDPIRNVLVALLSSLTLFLEEKVLLSRLLDFVEGIVEFPILRFPYLRGKVLLQLFWVFRTLLVLLKGVLELTLGLLRRGIFQPIDIHFVGYRQQSHCILPVFRSFGRGKIVVPQDPDFP